MTNEGFSYYITGSVAHKRLVPLLTANTSSTNWVDAATSATTARRTNVSLSGSDNNDEHPTGLLQQHHPDDDNENSARCDSVALVDFLWENAPRPETKAFRDHVKCYSHLPNGTNILDSKWVLGRLLGDTTTTTTKRCSSSATTSSTLAVLETHCFRGPAGFTEFSKKVGLYPQEQCNMDSDATKVPSAQPTTIVFPDLLEATVHTADCLEQPSNDMLSAPPPPPPCPNLWVIKDAWANGAGGIWMVGPDELSYHETYQQLSVDHAYVAQQYAWPPVLYRQRKCHVRVYALLTATGQAYVHNQCFLHVANDPFTSAGSLADQTTMVVASGHVNSESSVAKSSSTQHSSSPYPDSVHITNCCANSHDPMKFAGEICANLELSEHQYNNGKDNDGTNGLDDGKNLTLGLASFAPSIYASVAALVDATFPFLQGGEANNGFEYLGLDFILSYKPRRSDHQTGFQSQGDPPPPAVMEYQPVAYLLEVNAPPSQDTATGLPHAETVHDAVLRDLLTLWVYPSVTGAAPIPGGWQCVYGDATPTSASSSSSRVSNGAQGESTLTDMILPSKAAILNRIRWTLYERKRLAMDQMRNAVVPSTDRLELNNNSETLTHYARAFYSYYAQSNAVPNCQGESSASLTPAYFENAGGTQVPSLVVNGMISSLTCRHRAVIGTKSAARARETMGMLLGAPLSLFTISLGPNASSLLATLAHRYVETGQLRRGDEIVLSSENHVANVEPWLRAAQLVGAHVAWWDPPIVATVGGRENSRSATLDPVSSWQQLESLLSAKTRILAFPHASNIVGIWNDVKRVRQLVNQVAPGGYCHIVVDGVAAVPHRYAALEQLHVDWYVVSCHKLFGPHLGVLCGRNSTVQQLENAAAMPPSMNVGIEIGTMNYEACEGVHGLVHYFAGLANFSSLSSKETHSDMYEHVSFVSEKLLAGTIPLDRTAVVEAYRLMESCEGHLMSALLHGLCRSDKVHVIHDPEMDLSMRLPILCFVHRHIRCSFIVDWCRKAGVLCRSGAFLSTTRQQTALFSLLHAHGSDNDLAETNVDEGVVRFSLTHYNTIEEVDRAMAALESIPGWF